MRRKNLFDFKPTNLKKLSLEVEKILEKKEKEYRNIFDKVKKDFKL